MDGKKRMVAREWNDPQWMVCAEDDEFDCVCITSQGDDEAKARHLVACWNACLPFTTTALESGVVAELVAACKDNDLAWILDNAIGGDLSSDDPGTLDKLLRTRSRLRAVLAKVRGTDTYTPSWEREDTDHAVPGEPMRLVHINVPFWDVFVLVLKIQVSLFLIGLPFAVIAYLYWS